ncbi:BTAD domain-containing putative transcriptional regulator [Micromonospora sp. HUAS LYJ1]|uniref:BTAD domain-containing putative transcriptional regulator n=1 Tax=Micromonospora sp. HUAS LYJ1 TaxID=3061626 RepID=UPI002674051C|nr:BTAD domain-containing putative transcriptional regulator [Micromonospora sp. HUAS LYJ1]WKU05745.1 BTAD domain-containing putative transcriptional regulator [Micromonospora sp. HUAS LYJ1]
MTGGDAPPSDAEPEGSTTTAPEGRLRVSVLGPVRAWRGDREVALGPARQRVVFALLAAAVGRDVGRDTLIAGVWGPSPPGTAAGSVYTYVSGLRRALGPGSLTSGAGGYALRLHPEDLDSAQFEALDAEAGRLRAAGDRTAAVARLDEALRLWRGEAYAGLTGDRIDAARDRLAERRLAAAEARARMLIEIGDDTVVADLAVLVRDHPLRESLHELLVLALHGAGRRAEAAAAWRAARDTLRAELGVEPGATLARLRPVVAGEPHGEPAGRTGAGAGRATGHGGSPAVDLPGREAELRLLRELVGAVVAGRGAAVWVEGEPGIGKTSLLRAAFDGAAERGCRVAWGSGAEPDQHGPLPAASRALGLAVEPGDPTVAGLPGGAAAAAGSVTDRVLAEVRAVCATGPLVLVLDDLPGVDRDGAGPFWERLVALTRRLPLLLVAAARLEPGGRELSRLRRVVQVRQGHLLHLDGLPTGVVEQVVAGLVGAPPGPNLAEVVADSAGNPRYAHELTTALLRRGVVRVLDDVADIPDGTAIDPPRPLLAMIRATMDGLTSGTQEVLRTAALLGTRFSVDDVGAVAGHPGLDPVAGLEEALAARVVVDAGTDLAFRHRLVRQMLYEGIPAPARSALHRHIAEVLADGGRPVVRVAEQLAAATSAVDGWVVSWLTTHHVELARRAPRLAGGLLRRVLGTDRPEPGQRVLLLVALVRLEFRHGRAAPGQAREAVRLATDPADRAEMRHLLAMMAHRDGDVAAALGVVEEALADPAVPTLWHTRHRMLRASLRRGPLDDLDRADRTAAAAHRAALAANQPYEAAFALQTTWLTNTIRRDHERALEYVDRALDVMRDNPAFGGLYLDLLDNRAFTLQNLDRLEEAERTLREAALFALRHRLPSGLHVAAAVQHYWSGRWDDVLTVVGAVTDDPLGSTLLGTREPGSAAMLLHGAAALVAAHRDDPVLAGGHLDATELVPATEAERENSDFLLVARALVAERQGRPEQALHLLDPLLVPAYAPMLMRHQWLPGVVRLALELGRRDVAQRAAAICADEAAREVRPVRAYTAALRCRALLTGDAEPALAAAGHYRAVGRVVERAAALEDAAVLLAAGRRPHEAARAGGAAAELYAVLGAAWDLRRTRRRLGGYGVSPAADGRAEHRGAQRTSISCRE